MGTSNSGRRPAHEEMRLKANQLSSRQVADLTKISMARLDWWAKSGFVSPIKVVGEGKGSVRIWHKDIIWEIKDLAHRLDACPYDHKTA